MRFRFGTVILSRVQRGPLARCAACGVPYGRRRARRRGRCSPATASTTARPHRRQRPRGRAARLGSGRDRSAAPIVPVSCRCRRRRTQSAGGLSPRRRGTGIGNAEQQLHQRCGSAPAAQQRSSASPVRSALAPLAAQTTRRRTAPAPCTRRLAAALAPLLLAGLHARPLQHSRAATPHHGTRDDGCRLGAWLPAARVSTCFKTRGGRPRPRSVIDLLARRRDPAAPPAAASSQRPHPHRDTPALAPPARRPPATWRASQPGARRRAAAGDAPGGLLVGSWWAPGGLLAASGPALACECVNGAARAIIIACWDVLVGMPPRRPRRDTIRPPKLSSLHCCGFGTFCAPSLAAQPAHLAVFSPHPTHSQLLLGVHGRYRL